MKSLDFHLIILNYSLVDFEMQNESYTFLSWQVSGVNEKIELRWNCIEICLPVVDQAAAVSVDANCE